MLKLSKKADYALIAVRHLATHTRGLAERIRYRRSLRHFRAAAGEGSAAAGQERFGYGAPWFERWIPVGAAPAKEISALEVISAVDGPLMITSCVTNHGNCDQSSTCTVREPLRRVNESIAQVLRAVTISQMTEESPDAELVGLSI